MIAVIDETTPEVNGTLLYVVVSAVILEEEDAARHVLRNVLPPGRQRQFHWHTEGPVAREAMLAVTKQLDVLAHAVMAGCGRRGQRRARARALTTVVEKLVQDGCPSLIVESRGTRSDGLDRRVILDALRGVDPADGLNYTWRDKREPLLWLADALGGALREHLTDTGNAWYHRFAATTAMEYRFLPTVRAPGM